MRNAVTLALVVLLSLSVGSGISAERLASARVELSPDAATAPLPGDVIQTPGVRGPARDPGQDEIFYDDGNPQLLNIAQNYWSRVSFTPLQPFTLMGWRLQLYNPNNLNQPRCSVRIYRETGNDHNLGDLEWSTELQNMPSQQWIAVDLNQNDYLDFGAGEHFSIVYGPAPGGNPQQGARGWWNLLDNSQPQTDHSFIYVGAQPSTQHNQWTAIGRDLLCRANGEYGGEVINLTLSGIWVNDADGDQRWTSEVNMERTLVAEVTNAGRDVDGFMVVFLVETADGDSVWGSEVVYDNALNGQDLVEVSPEEPWVPDATGSYVISAEVIPFEEDNLPEDNAGELEHIVFDPVNEPDQWIGYLAPDYQFERNYYNTDSTGFATYFWHPGGDGAYKMTKFRVCLRVPQGTQQDEIPFAVMRLYLDRGWEIIYSTEVAVERTGDAVWYEVDIPEEEQVAFDVTQAMIVCWFFREIGNDQNAWIMMKHDETPPISGANPDMPTTNRWSADIWQDGFNHDWSNGEWAIEAQFVAAAPPGPHLAIDPEAVEFGYGLQPGQDHTLTLHFSAIGDSTVHISTIEAGRNVRDYVRFSRTTFDIEPGTTEDVIVTFNVNEVGDFSDRVRVVNNSRNLANNLFLSFHANTQERVILADRNEINFGENLSTGTYYIQTFEVLNPAASTVTVSDIWIPENLRDELTAEPSSFELFPNEPVTVTLYLNANQIHQIFDDIIIENNSQNNPQLALRIRANVLGIGEQAGKLPHEWALGQNRPNPFNPSTTVDFALKDSGPVELAVFDLRGGLVKTLASGWMPAGYHSVKINAADLPAGVYLYRLSTPQVTLTRKMLLMR